MSESKTLLNPRQQSFLRARAHHLNPVVTVGNAGLSPAVINEIQLALGHHELIKIKLNVGDRELRQQMSADICSRTDSTPVQNIGRICVIYKQADKPTIKLPE